MKYSTTGLFKAGLSLVAPFGVDVLMDPVDDLAEPISTLEFKEIARVLPERRVSGFAEFKSGLYFAKIFYGPHARRYWNRELLGARTLLRHEIPCARIRRHGATADGAGYVVLYEALSGASDVTDGATEVIAQTVDVIARMHEAGLIQTDVHLANFVHTCEGVFAVDADGIRRSRLLRQHFANLGMFLAQRRPYLDTEVASLWERYAAVRGEYVGRMGSVAKIVKTVKRQRRIRVKRYLRKTMRECTDFHHAQTFSSNVVCERGSWQSLQRLCLFPEKVFAEGTPIKLGNSATVVRMTIDGASYVVKRYNIKGTAHRVKRWFKRRGRNAWRNGHHLAFLGIPTARPVALIEKRFFWLTGVCYLVMRDRGDRNLGQVLTDPDMFDEVAPQTVDLLDHLTAANLSHGDLKATNLVVHDGEVVLIDFDGLERGSNIKDLTRFMQNWQASSEIHQRWQAALEERGLVHPGLGLYADAAVASASDASASDAGSGG